MPVMLLPLSVTGTVASIFGLRREREKQQQQEQVVSKQQAALNAARCKDGKLSKSAAEQLEHAFADSTEEECNLDIARAAQRDADAQLAGQLDRLDKECAAYEQAVFEFDRQETARRKAALAELEAKRAAFAQKMNERNGAMVARQRLLDTAFATQEERDLIAENAKVVKLLADVNQQLNPNAVPSIAGAAYMASEHPAAMLREARQKLQALKPKGVDEHDDARRGRYQHTITVALAAVEKKQLERVDLEAQRDKIQARLLELSNDKLKPENFQILRRRETVDEKRKRVAKEQGWY